MKTILKHTVLFLLAANLTSAQSITANDSTTALYIESAAGFGLAITTVHFARYTPLWDDYKTSFFIEENSGYASNYDKFLHFYGGVVSADMIASGFRLQGYKQEESVLMGSALSSLFYLYIEIEDAHINYLGFDRVDFGVSVLGSAYPALQYYVPFFNSFTPKFSYKSSGLNTTTAKQYSPQFLSDHEGQTYWMGITVGDLLPKEYQQLYPRWLGLAAGYSMRNLGHNVRHEYYAALDVDLRTIDTNSEFLNTVLRTLNYIHFPMPGIKFTNGKAEVGFYF